MKILHINRNYMDNPLHQLMVEQLEAAGYSDSVFSPRLFNEKSKIIPKPYVIARECTKKWHRFFFFYKQKKIVNAAESTFNVGEYDLIHAYTLFTDGNCAWNLFKKYGIPYVVAVRNTDVNSFFRLMPHLRKRGIKIMSDAKAVFFLSESYRDQVFDKYVPEECREKLLSKTYIIPNGIDDFWFNNAQEGKAAPDKNNLKLIYAGRIDKNKNIPTTQNAIKILEKKGYKAHLTVIGRVEDASELKRIAENPSTTYLPSVTKEKLIDYYRSSDIFVMPSFTESFGLVYVEAMSQGLPVVYSLGQGFDGQFEEGAVGYHADPHSPESVADAIEKIIDNYSLISMAVNGKAKKFNWSKIIESYISIYEQIKSSECAR